MTVAWAMINVIESRRTTITTGLIKHLLNRYTLGSVGYISRSQKRFIIMIRWLICCLLVISAHVHADTQGCKSLQSISWILGNWQSTSQKYVTKESWQKVSTKTFEGRGEAILIQSGNVVEAETLRLVEMSDEVFFLAKVKSNSLPIAFKLTQCGKDIAEFSNSTHDFPQTLRYQRYGKNALHVLVAGENGKQFMLEYKLVE